MKYFWVVSALILVQMLLGVITAHYGVEGDGVLRNSALRSGCRTASPAPGTSSSACSGSPRPGWRPGCSSARWSASRSRRASAWASTSCFGALLVVVVGSLTGEWLSVHNKLTDAVSFYFGHQGYEYVDLGRVWQIGLLVGLLLWLFLMVRVAAAGAAKAGRAEAAGRAAGRFHGRPSPCSTAPASPGASTRTSSIVEYWRWWVVHLWVEGFFEVFATTVIAFLFMRLNLIRPGVAAARGAALGHDLSVRRHHRHVPPPVLLRHADGRAGLGLGLQRAGSGAAGPGRLRRHGRSAAVENVALGATVQVADLLLRRRRVLEHGRRRAVRLHDQPADRLYYMQGLNTTPLHGHAALFGVYGMLGIGLMLVCLRVPGARPWSGRMACCDSRFWSMNGGLMAMCVLSLLPVGLMQTWASVEHGYWYARSAEFLQTPLMQNLRWMRVPGDTVFFLGAVALVLFVAGLKTGHSFKR